MLFILVGAFYTPKTVDASFTVKNHQYPLKFTLPYLTKQVIMFFDETTPFPVFRFRIYVKKCRSHPQI